MTFTIEKGSQLGDTQIEMISKSEYFLISWHWQSTFFLLRTQSILHFQNFKYFYIVSSTDALNVRWAYDPKTNIVSSFSVDIEICRIFYSNKRCSNCVTIVGKPGSNNFWSGLCRSTRFIWFYCMKWKCHFLFILICVCVCLWAKISVCSICGWSGHNSVHAFWHCFVPEERTAL